MERLVFGAVADDDTGASDLAGMLAERGVQTLQVIDLPDEAQFMEWSRGYQAVVMAEGTRNLPPEQARPHVTPLSNAKGVGCLIVAGSCSQATRQQNARYLVQGGAALRIDPYQLLDNSMYRQQLSAQAAEQIRRGAPCLLFSSGEPEEVRSVQQ